MGFFSNIFGGGASNVGIEYVNKYRPLMLNSVNGDMPKTDTKGNKVSNITRISISGTTHQHLNSNPEREIKRLKAGQLVVLVPDPDNEYDNEAIRVMTTHGKQIGWIPKSYPYKTLIFQRLIQQYEVFCCVYDCGISKSNMPWCELTLVTYGTPFDPSLQEKNPNSYLTFLLKLKSKI